MPFFDLIIRWVGLSDFGPKSDDLGQRIHKSDVIPSDFGKLDCVSRPTFFSVRKIKIRSLESDRIINGLKACFLFFCPSAEEQDPPVRRKLIGCAKSNWDPRKTVKCSRLQKAQSEFYPVHREECIGRTGVCFI